MSAPNTGGQLHTKIQDMQVGDFIVWATKDHYGQFGVSTEGLTEIPVTGITWGNSTNNTFGYGIKVDKGIIVFDRVRQHSVSWDTLNASKIIQGTPVTIKNAGVNFTGILRSLGGGCAYADMKSIIPVMTSNTEPTGIASASSEWFGSGQTYSAYRAFNKTTTNEYDIWASARKASISNPDWLAYEFTTPKIVTKYAITSGNNQTYGRAWSPKDWTFEGWDGAQWVVLDRQVGVTNWGAATKKVFVFQNATACLKYRINVTANVDPAIAGLAIGELEMFDQHAIDNATISLTDKGLGAWPMDNEWDEYIVQKDYGTGSGRDDVWHWNVSNGGNRTWMQETPITGLTRKDKALIGANNYRIYRPFDSNIQSLSFNVSSLTDPTVGFRPVFEYQE